MPTLIRFHTALAASPTTYDADGARLAQIPTNIYDTLPAPASSAANPVYRIKFVPTSGTAATLPGDIVITQSSAGLSSLTGTLTTARPLDVSQTFIGIFKPLGFELIARALPYTTAEITAALPDAPTDDRIIAGSLTISYSDISTQFTGKFGTTAAAQVSVLSGYCPRDLSLSAGEELDVTITIALTACPLNCEIELLLICQG